MVPPASHSSRFQETRARRGACRRPLNSGRRSPGWLSGCPRPRGRAKGGAATSRQSGSPQPGALPQARSPDDVSQDEQLHRAVHEPHFTAADEHDARRVVLEQEGPEHGAAACHGSAARAASRRAVATAGLLAATRVPAAAPPSSSARPAETPGNRRRAARRSASPPRSATPG